VVSGSIEHLAPWLSFVSDGFTELDAQRFVERKRASGTRHGVQLRHLTGRGRGRRRLRPDRAIGAGASRWATGWHPGHTGGGLAPGESGCSPTRRSGIGADRVEIHHDLANERSAGIPRRLGFVEVARRPNPSHPRGRGRHRRGLRLCRTS